MGCPKRANDIASLGCVIIAHDISVLDALAIMTREKTATALVINCNQELLGVISDDQLIEPFLQTIYSDSSRGLVQDFMDRDFVHATPETSLVNLAQKFLYSKIEIIPILENNLLIGVVTRHALIQALSQKRFSNKTRLRHRQNSIVGLWGHRIKITKGSALPNGFDSKLGK